MRSRSRASMQDARAQLNYSYVNAHYARIHARVRTHARRKRGTVWRDTISRD